MQVERRYHREFAEQLMPDGVTFKWQDPAENINYATGHVLKPYMDYFLQPGLRLPQRLAMHCGVAAYNCGVGGAMRGLRETSHTDSLADRIRGVDSRTTGHDYSQDVIQRFSEFKARSLNRSST